MKDTELIAKRQEKKRQMGYTIENEVVVDGVPYTFSRRELYDGQFSLVLPEQFFPMPEDAARLKFPSENRPKVILCSADGGVCFTFNWMETLVSATSVGKNADALRTVIKRINPAFIFHSQGKYKISEQIVLGYFDFTSYAVDADLYNRAFAVNIGERLLVGSFICSKESWSGWEPLVEQMLNSLQDHTESTAEEEKRDG